MKRLKGIRWATLLFVTSALLLGGCSQEDGFESDEGDRVAISFTAGIDGAGALPTTQSAGLHSTTLDITGVTDVGVPYADYVAADGFPSRAFYPSRRGTEQRASDGGLKTRSTAGGNGWLANDPVGIFMLNKDGMITNSTDLLADNKKYNATPLNPASEASFAPADATNIYYPQTSNVDFIAYYPYGAVAAGSTTAGEVNSTDYTYNISVADQSDPAAIDLLYAKKTNVQKSHSTVHFGFGHKLSKVTLNVMLGDGLTSLSGSDITAVRFSGMPLTATLALQDGTLTAGAVDDFSSLKTGLATNTATFTAILIPQPSGRTGRTAVFTVGGKDYLWTIPNDHVFASGNHYTYPVTVKLNGINVGTATIDDWVQNTGPGTNPETEMDFVKIPAGTFIMGSPDGTNGTTAEPNRSSNEAQHGVTLTQDFYMGKYQVTNAQYAAFLKATGIGSTGKGDVSYYKEGMPVTENQTFIFASSGSENWGLNWSGVDNKWIPVSGYEKHPAINVTWYGAKAYADWMGGSLPTEAQWEYGCRAGTTTAYSYGDTANGDYMWYSSNNTTNGEINGTKTVGRKQANVYGLYDMHGNVYEWCLDQWDGSNNYGYHSLTDPLCTTGFARVLRGGSWDFNAQYCRSAYRSIETPSIYDYTIGFRVAVVP